MTTGRHDARAAFRFRDFRRFLILSCFAVIAEQMLGVAIGWELYERTDSAFALGLVGLVQVVPVVLLALPAGHIVDSRNRKLVACAAFLGAAVSAFGLTIMSAIEGPLVVIYGCLALMGVARSFQSPVMAALVSQTVPPEHFANAATWESSIWQGSSIAGPAIGGLLIALLNRATPIYALAAVALVIVAGITLTLSLRPVAHAVEQMTVDSLLAGLRFVRTTKVILASITLDLFAVLLGGATALLPVFAKDVLDVGATGLGFLRAAPAVGAVFAGLALAHARPFARAGRVLLSVVAGFGVVTVIFGLSNSFWLSLGMQGCLGALDNISVVIRSTLMLSQTPDELRGRVNAVHYVFIGLSNELGAFESGMAAALLGAAGAVVAGGIGTILVVPLIAFAWPEIRRLGRMDQPPAWATASDEARAADLSSVR